MANASSKSMQRRAVVGTHKKGARISRRKAEGHALGFGQALENALDDACRVFYPRAKISAQNPRKIDVTVTFEATASVWNPGVIDEYRAIITEVP
jgi:hypothetical protein